MNHKLTMVATAVAVGLSAQAQAAVDQDALNLFTGVGNGELFVSVVERDVGLNYVRSYNRDLGLRIDDFFDGATQSFVNPGTLTFGPDALMTSFLGTVGTGNTVSWNIAAISNGVPVPFGGPVSWGFLSTSASPTVTGSEPGLVGGYTNLGNYWTNINPYFQNVNFAENAVSGSGTTNYAANGSFVVTAANDPFGAKHDSPNFGTNWVGIDTENLLGDMSAFWFIGQDNADATASVTKVVNLGPEATGWILQTNGTLVYNPSVVPLPAGVWLLGAGMLGYLGLGRRRTEA